MQTYISSKITLAEECSKETFDRAKNDDFKASDVDLEKYYGIVVEEPEGGFTKGYHIVYPNPNGTKYHSWSPADVFERSNRRIETDEKELIATY